jgi:hypothetical protein
MGCNGSKPLAEMFMTVNLKWQVEPEPHVSRMGWSKQRFVYSLAGLACLPTARHFFRLQPLRCPGRQGDLRGRQGRPNLVIKTFKNYD